MSALYLLSGLAAGFLLAYLVYALFNAEDL